VKPALIVTGIVKKFGNHVAVDHISFEVPRGVVYGILGPNGAGKTTTLRMINDIIAPDAGEIVILDGLKPGGDAAAHIGYLPEERGLYPKMKVVEMITFMGELRGLKHVEAKRRADKWLDRLGLAQWTKNKVQDLSKGMQQKVQFATALIHDPALVILDEPWSGLDPINAEVLREVVAEIRKAGRTVLFSTHQMEQAEKVCDQVCIIARGKKVLDGELRDIKRAWGGNAYTLRIEGNSKPLAGLPGVDTMTVSADDPGRVKLLLRADADGADVLKAAVGHVRVLEFRSEEPDLEQIFIKAVRNATE
jgi:ABC-2 type transport system ATP-binding protein